MLSAYTVFKKYSFCIFLMFLFITSCKKEVLYDGDWSVGLADVNSISEIEKTIGKTFLDSANFENSLDYRFLADPFLYKDDSGIYLFCEHLIRAKGNICCFYSKDTVDIHFKYRGSVLDETFHLSYPQVFEYNGQMYMLPETQGSGSVLLYTTKNFPYEWKLKKKLINKKVKDPTLLIMDDKFYIFGAIGNKLYYWVADALDGVYVQQPAPVLEGVESRPGGRIFAMDDNILLPVQNHEVGYGTGLSLYNIIKNGQQLRLEKYKGLFLKPQPEIPQFRAGMHHFDFIMVNGKYLCVFDGHDKKA